MAKRTSKTTLGKLNNIPVAARKKAASPHRQHGGCNHIVVLPGYGKSDFKFPEVEELVINSLTRLAKDTSPLVEDAVDDGAERRTRRDFGLPPIRVQMNDSFIPNLPAAGVTPAMLIPQLPEEQQAGKGLGPTLWVASEGVRQVLYRGRFDAIIADRFDPLAGAVNWAAQNMEPKYRPAIMSLGGQLGQLRALYREALPRVLSVLAGQNPKAPAHQLLEAAVGSLDEELSEILTVLRIWTDAFGQLRDGLYKQLQAVTFVVEQAFKLFETGALDDTCTKGNCRPKLESNIFQVGSVFVARFSPQGPSTLPGSKGPIKAHAIEVPHDEREMISLMLVLYTHEFRHDIFADIRGLADELTESVVSAIVTNWQQNNFNFLTDKQKIGKFSYEAIELIAKLFADTIGEVDADISGGVLSVGPAFLYNMVMTFCAFNSRGRSVFAAREADQLLRAGSFYETGKDGRISFLPHPPDYIRAYIVAAALDEIGFPEEADQCRALADQAVGLPLPEYITWEDSDGKSKSVVKIAMKDLIAVAPVVARVLIRQPLKSLGGLSTSDLVNWNADRQKKVDVLAQNLMAGNAIVPSDMGDFYATYVAAAATMAYWGLTEGGRRVEDSIARVEKNALKMLDTVRERLSAPELVPGASASLCGCGKDHAPDVVPEPGHEPDRGAPKGPCTTP